MYHTIYSWRQSTTHIKLCQGLIRAIKYIFKYEYIKHHNCAIAVCQDTGEVKQYVRARYVFTFKA